MKILDVPRSGSYQGITSSRNRFGQYVRTRATPVNPRSSFQGAVRDRLSLNATTWRSLTTIQRAGWESLGAQIQRNDSLGQTYTLNGFAAYCLVNNNNLTAGNATVASAPSWASPGNIATATVTLTAAVFSIAYTVTPLPAGARLLAFASGPTSAGRMFGQDQRLIQVSAAAAASPLDIFTSYETRMGVPTVGSAVFIALTTYLGGFTSAPLLLRQIVA
jgi:hypothetical protein